MRLSSAHAVARPAREVRRTQPCLAECPCPTTPPARGHNRVKRDKNAPSRDARQAGEAPGARPSPRHPCPRPEIVPTEKQNGKNRDTFSTRGSKQEQIADRARCWSEAGRSRVNSRVGRRPHARANRDHKLPGRASARGLMRSLVLAITSPSSATRLFGQFRFRAKRCPPGFFRSAAPKPWNRSQLQSGGH